MSRARLTCLTAVALTALLAPGSALGAAYRPPPATSCSRNPYQPSCDGWFADTMTIVTAVVIALIGLAWLHARWARSRPEGAERLRRKLRRRRIARALRLNGPERELIP